MIAKKIREKDNALYSLTEDVAGRKVLFVNHFLIGKPGNGNPWVLVDAGLPGATKRIIKDAEELFGANNPPLAIILTHGHFDHSGTLPELLKEWPQVQVYVHPLELPYLTGRASYQDIAGDEGTSGFSFMTWAFPLKNLDLGYRVHALPVDGSIPFLPDWRYIHTPGHSPGHISLFREKDRLLIAGDAFTSTNQDVVTSVLLQKKEVHGPPQFLTVNWREALRSIRKLAELDPLIAGTGHGVPLKGRELKDALHDLLQRFFNKEIPYFIPGNYWEEDELKAKPDFLKIGLIAGSIALLTGTAFLVMNNLKKSE